MSYRAERRNDDDGITAEEKCDQLSFLLVLIRATLEPPNNVKDQQGYDEEKQKPPCRSYFPTEVVHPTPPLVFPSVWLELRSRSVSNIGDNRPPHGELLRTRSPVLSESSPLASPFGSHNGGRSSVLSFPDRGGTQSLRTRRLRNTAGAPVPAR